MSPPFGPHAGQWDVFTSGKSISLVIKNVACLQNSPEPVCRDI